MNPTEAEKALLIPLLEQGDVSPRDVAIYFGIQLSEVARWINAHLAAKRRDERAHALIDSVINGAPHKLARHNLSL